MRITTLDQAINAGRKYLNERSLQIGHVLPLSEKIFREYFPERNSFLLYSVRAVDALFSFHSGREKWTLRADFAIVTDSLAGLKEAVGRVEDRSEEHTSELQSPCNLVCRLLLEKKKKKKICDNIAASL